MHQINAAEVNKYRTSEIPPAACVYLLAAKQCGHGSWQHVWILSCKGQRSTTGGSARDHIEREGRRCLDWIGWELDPADRRAAWTWRWEWQPTQGCRQADLNCLARRMDGPISTHHRSLSSLLLCIQYSCNSSSGPTMIRVHASCVLYGLLFHTATQFTAPSSLVFPPHFFN